ncbi:MAG: 2-hydroxyglutaryl-CoA dehydratase, partial [Oribacterium sp.]|nr:2-hydroxyglutaryl-CoA dehydratase [Oribacterium sp.]
MYTLGVDIGSTTAKAVILENGERIVASSIIIATVGTSGV